MKRLLVWVVRLVALALIMFVLRTCVFPPKYSWNQKITLTVMVDGKLYSGSSVDRVTWVLGNLTIGDVNTMRGAYTRGEAAAVALPRGRYLFALTPVEKMVYPVVNLIGVPGATRKQYAEDVKNYGEQAEWHQAPREQGVKYAAEVGGAIELTIDKYNYPQLVTFTDLNDPKSVQLVDPLDLAATFGAGVSLQSTKLVVTSDSMTDGVVQSVLPWLCEQLKNDTLLNGATIVNVKDDLPSSWLSAGYFKTGPCQ